MLFNSLEYLVFFPVTAFLYFIAPKKYAYLVLLAASLFFYASFNISYLFLMLTTILVTYACGVAIEKFGERDKTRKLLLMSSLIINVGILFFFKYFDFFLENVNTAFGSEFLLLNFLLPVGISFYTFQAIGYTIDVYRKSISAEKNVLKYALFVSFFPQLVAGPIERSTNLLPQLNRPKQIKYDNILNGLLIMSWGFFLKLVIADRVAVVVNSVYGDYTSHGGAVLSFATVFFAFQIYCDFFSYSTIAVGSAKVLGIQLSENFKAPYLSPSISAFWQRWHISLSEWFQEYIFTPLVWVNPFKKIPVIGKFFKNPPVILSILIVFFVSGLWHGAAWTFVVWGLLHGIFRAVEIITKKYRKKINKKLKINSKSAVYKSLCVLFTFFLVCISYVFFRSASIGEAFAIIAKIFTEFEAVDLSVITSLGLSARELIFTAIFLLVLLLHDVLYTKKILLPTTGYKRYLLIWIFVMATLVFGVYGTEYVLVPFIYFQF